MRKHLLSIIISLLFVSACSSKTPDYMEQRKAMVEKQILWRGITNQLVLDTMLKVPREEFVPPQHRNKAYADLALPTGEGETLDRPYEDAFILQALNLSHEDKVLEIGTGSGYLTALIAQIAKRVFTIDIVPSLTEEAVRRFNNLGYTNIVAKSGDGFLGWPENAPFTAVVLTCSPPNIPTPLIDQLEENGRLILPLGGENRFQELLLYTKQNGKLGPPTHLAAATFVPMKGKAKGE